MLPVGDAGQNPGKTAAIILGGVAGVTFLVICLLFARSLKKKHEGMSYIIYYLLLLLLYILSALTDICVLILSFTHFALLFF